MLNVKTDLYSAIKSEDSEALSYPAFHTQGFLYPRRFVLQAFCTLGDSYTLGVSYPWAIQSQGVSYPTMNEYNKLKYVSFFTSVRYQRHIFMMWQARYICIIMMCKNTVLNLVVMKVTLTEPFE